MIDGINSAAETWFRYMASASVQATLLALALMALVAAGKRWSSSLRYALLMVALIKFAIPPTLHLPTGLFSRMKSSHSYEASPSVMRIPPVVQEALWPAESMAFDSPLRVGGETARKSDGVTVPARTAGRSPAPIAECSLSLRGCLLMVHLAGVGLILLIVLLQSIRLRRVLSRAVPASESTLLDTYKRLCVHLKLRRQPALLLTQENHAPMAFGIFKPVILLPESLAQKLQPSEIDVILGHELAHHRRRDLLLSWLQVPISAVWWFNPVYWMLSRRLRSICEDGCDDLVVASGLSTSEDYCQTLLQAAKLISGSAMARVPFGYISEPQPLHRRFKRMMGIGFVPGPKLALGGLLVAVSLGLVFLPGIQPGALRTSSLFRCEPAPEIRQALGNLPDLFDFWIPRDERLQPLRTLAGKYPDDIFVQSRFQDTFRVGGALFQERDREFALYRSKPADPLSRYLEARLTASFNPQKAEEMYKALIEREPAFPWPHLAIAELTDRRGFRDVPKAEAHLRSFLTACPECPEGYAMLRTVDDPEMLHNGAIKLRSLLEARKDAWSLRYWRRLWNLEFRVAPAGTQETVRRRILQDIASLQEVPPVDNAEWTSVFRAAYELTGEESVEIWLEDTIFDQFPRSSSAIAAEWWRWSREHQPPVQDARPEEKKAYQDSRRAFKEELSRRWPDDPDPLMEKWDELETDATISLSERLAIVDEVTLLIRKSPDWVDFADPPFPISVAELYLQWQTRLDEIPALIKHGIQEAESRYQYYPDASMIPGGGFKPSTQYNWAFDIRQTANLTLANAYLLQEKLDLAREVINGSTAELDQNNPRRGDWLYPQGRLAELAGDSGEALAFYQKHVARMARWILSDRAQSNPKVWDQIAVIKRLYLANGGSEESWPAWCTAGGEEGPVKPPSMKIEYLSELPDFEAKDLSGKTWRLADLKGKATLVDVWTAVGSNSAVRELPELQRFCERIKGHRDLQMLTFSIDENPYQAERLLAEGNYTFPVISSRTLGERLFPVRTLPLAWIIDAKGRRSSSFRFRNIDLILSEVEKAAVAQ